MALTICRSENQQRRSQPAEKPAPERVTLTPPEVIPAVGYIADTCGRSVKVHATSPAVYCAPFSVMLNGVVKVLLVGSSGEMQVKVESLVSVAFWITEKSQRKCEPPEQSLPLTTTKVSPSTGPHDGLMWLTNGWGYVPKATPGALEYCCAFRLTRTRVVPEDIGGMWNRIS